MKYFQYNKIYIILYPSLASYGLPVEVKQELVYKKVSKKS